MANSRVTVPLSLPDSYSRALAKAGGATQQFVSSATSALRKVDATLSKISRNLNSLGTNFDIRTATRDIIDLDDKLTRVGIQSDVTNRKLLQLKQSISDVARTHNISNLANPLESTNEQPSNLPENSVNISKVLNAIKAGLDGGIEAIKGISEIADLIGSLRSNKKFESKNKKSSTYRSGKHTSIGESGTYKGLSRKHIGGKNTKKYGAAVAKVFKKASKFFKPISTIVTALAHISEAVKNVKTTQGNKDRTPSERGVVPVYVTNFDEMRFMEIFFPEKRGKKRRPKPGSPNPVPKNKRDRGKGKTGGPVVQKEKNGKGKKDAPATSKKGAAVVSKKGASVVSKKGASVVSKKGASVASSIFRKVGRRIPGLSIAASLPLIFETAKNVKTIQGNKNLTDSERGAATGEAVGATAGSVTGSAAGATAGALIGSAIFPGIGTAIGGLIGGIAGEFLGKRAGKTLGKHAGKKLAESKDKKSTDKKIEENKYSYKNEMQTYNEERDYNRMYSPYNTSTIEAYSQEPKQHAENIFSVEHSPLELVIDVNNSITEDGFISSILARPKIPTEHVQVNTGSVVEAKRFTP